MSDDLLTGLLRARRFDEILVDNGERLSGAYHVSIGAEAVGAALSVVRADGDAVMLNHRNHGPLVALGSEAEPLYRELLGRDGGLQRGRSGSFHLADPARGVPYTSAMLGGGAALAAGLALAFKRRGQTAIAFVLFGDGAMGEGIIYEVLNLLVAWQLAVVMVCDNNASAGHEGRLAELAEAHGVSAAVVDGRLPRDTLTALRGAAQDARTNSRPRFIEVGTEPWPGNVSFLPRQLPPLDLARAAEAPAGAFEAGDPVRAEVCARLQDGASLDELLALDVAIQAELRTALEHAVAAPPAPAAACAEGVWASSAPLS